MDKLLVTSSSYRSLAAKVIAATISALVVVSGLAVPAQATGSNLLKSTSFTVDSGVSKLSLVAGRAAQVIEITSDVALTSAVTVDSTNETIEINPTATPNGSGVATFNISSAVAGDEVLTFSTAGHPDLEVEVTVADPALVSELDANVTKLDIRYGLTQSVKISSSDLKIPSDVLVTAVSSDSDIVSVTASVSPDAVTGKATFTVSAIGVPAVYQLGDTDIPTGKSVGDWRAEFLTFRADGYADIIVPVTPYDVIKSTGFTDGQSDSKNLALISGNTATTATISSWLALTSTDVVTVDSTNDNIVVAPSATPVNGVATFNISSKDAGEAVLTFSVANRPDLKPLDVNVTVTDPALAAAELEANVTSLNNIVVGYATRTVKISSSDLGLPSGTDVTAVSSDDQIVTVNETATVSNDKKATFTVTAVGLSSVYELGDDIPTGKAVGDKRPETITFRADGYAEVIVSVTTSAGVLASSAFTKDVLGRSKLTLGSGAAALPVGIFSEAVLTSAVTVDSTNENIVVNTSATPVNGLATFNIRSSVPGDAVLTFSTPGHPDLEVDVTVTDPRLVSELEANVTKVNVRIGATQSIRISSSDLNLPDGTPVTAVSSDMDIVTVTETAYANGSTNKASFTVSGVGVTAVYQVGDDIPTGKSVGDKREEFITFRADGYADVIVPVTTFDVIKSTGFTDGPSDNKTLALVTGKSGSAVTISSWFTLAASDVVTVDSTNETISVAVSAIPASGIASFIISGTVAGSGVLTFSVPTRPDLTPLDVNVTVTDPALVAQMVGGVSRLSILLGSSKTVDISSTDLGLGDSKVTAVSSDSDIVSVTESVNASSGKATFTVTAAGISSLYQLGDDIPVGKYVGDRRPETLTFRVDDYQDVYVDVTTFTDGQLDASARNLNIRVGSSSSETITSDDIPIPQGVAVTAVSSNPQVVTVNGSATASASNNAVFTINAIGRTTGTETITFKSAGYLDRVVNVTTFDELKSTGFVEGGNGRTISLRIGDAAKSATISSYVALAANQPVTAVSSNAYVSVTASATPNGSGVATFNIAGVSLRPSGPTTSVLTFSVAGRPDLAPLTVTATVTAGDLFLGEADLTRLSGVSLGQSKTVQLGSNGLASIPSDVVVSASVEGAVQGETPAITVDRSGTSNNTFVVTGAAVGTASVQFSAAGFTPVTVEVTVTKAELAAPDSYYFLYATDEVSFNVTSTQFPVGSASTLVPTIEGSEDPEVEVSIVGATVTIKGLKAGNAILTIADEAGNYIPVVIDVTVETPSLSSDMSSYELFYGQETVVTISSDELGLVEADTENVVPEVTGDSIELVGDPEFVAGVGIQFTYKGIVGGSSDITFTKEGFASATVNVSVEKPSLIAEQDASALFIGDKAIVTITSDEQAISEEDLGELTATSSNDEVLTAVVTPNEDGSASVEIEGVSAGSGGVTFSIPGKYEDASAQFTVSRAALKADVTSIRAFVGVPTTIQVSSDDQPLTESVTVTSKSGLAVGEDCTGEITGEGALEGEIANVTLCGSTKGSYIVTISAGDNYVPVTVRVVVVAPSLTSEVAKVAIFSGSTGEISIGANDVDLSSDISVTATSTNEISFEERVVAGEEGAAKFKFSATKPGVYKATFTALGFKPVTVSIVVTRPELVSDTLAITVNSGGMAEFTVSSNDVDLADSLEVKAELPADSEQGTVTAAEVASGEAVVTFVAGAIGKSSITVSAPNFKPVIVKVTVLPARLEVDSDSITSVVKGVSRIVVTSPDIAEFDPASLTPTPAKEGIVEIALSDESEPGRAIFDVTGAAKGSTKISFAGEGFATATVAVKINTTSLVASVSSLQLFAGQESTITISSPDLPSVDGVGGLTEDMGLEFAAFASAIDEPVVSYEDGQAIVTIKGAAKGRDKLLVSGTGFQKVSVAINVIEPALVTNVSSVTFRADGSATVKVSSRDLALSDETELTVEGIDGVVGESVVADGVATITLTAPEWTETAKVTGTLLIKATNYKSKSLRVTVTPTPVCTDKALGQIKFGDNDAKLSSAAKASITRFAKDLVANKCANSELTTYVPVANTRANAAKYAKELQLSTARAAAVKAAITAEVTKLGGATVTITVVRGTVPTSVLNGSASAQSSYRRIDVAAKADSAMMRARSRH